jgi:hypothetical protein
MRGPYEQSTSLPTVRFEYHPEGSPPWTLTRHLDTFRNPQDPIDAVRFIDGLKRNVQEKTDASIFLGMATTPTDAMIVSGRLTFDAVDVPRRSVTRSSSLSERPGLPCPSGHDRAHTDDLRRPRPTHARHGAGRNDHDVRVRFGVTRDGATQFETRNVDAKGASSFSYKNLREQVTAIRT